MCKQCISGNIPTYVRRHRSSASNAIHVRRDARATRSRRVRDARYSFSRILSSHPRARGRIARASRPRARIPPTPSELRTTRRTVNRRVYPSSTRDSTRASTRERAGATRIITSRSSRLASRRSRGRVGARDGDPEGGPRSRSVDSPFIRVILVEPVGGVTRRRASLTLARAVPRARVDV